MASITAKSTLADKLLILGDFNLPQINWEDGIGMCTASTRTGTPPENLLIKCLDENFLLQHTDQPTRYREKQAANILDLTITNMDTNVTSIKYLSPLGKSDHLILEIEIEADAIDESIKTVTPRKNWNKGDYHKIREDLEQIN